MRFTIRDLLWLTVVVALGVAWWIDRSRLAKELDFLKEPSHLTPQRTHEAVI